VWVTLLIIPYNKISTNDSAVEPAVLNNLLIVIFHAASTVGVHARVDVVVSATSLLLGFIFMVIASRLRLRCRTVACGYIARSSATAATSPKVLIITIVYFFDRWRILMCFGYTNIKFVYFLVKIGIFSTYLFLGYWPSAFVWSHCRCNVRNTGW